MSTLSQFMGGRNKVASVINGQSTSGQAGGAGLTSVLGAKALTLPWDNTGTLATALSVPSGRGTLNFAAVTSNYGPLRIKVTVDGRVIFDSSTNGAGSSIVAIGAVITSSMTAVFQPIPFESSLLIETSLTTAAGSGVYAAFLNYEINV